MRNLIIGILVLVMGASVASAAPRRHRAKHKHHGRAHAHKKSHKKSHKRAGLDPKHQELLKTAWL